MQRYFYITDPASSWLEVARDDLVRLRLIYRLRDPDTRHKDALVYLGARDLAQFKRAKEAEGARYGVDFVFEEQVHREPHHIRTFPTWINPQADA